jgi:hypothetical protein
MLDTGMTALLWLGVGLGYAWSVWKLGRVWRQARADEPVERESNVVQLRPRATAHSKTPVAGPSAKSIYRKRRGRRLSAAASWHT